MSTSQKVIKYLAIAFGIFLGVSIISSIVIGVLAFTNLFVGDENIQIDNEEPKYIADYEDEFDVSEVKDLDIELDIAKLNIQKSDKLGIVAYNLIEDFDCEVKDGTLKIFEDINMNRKVFNTEKVPYITLYIPEDFKFENVVIKSGVGNIDIEKLYANNLNVKFGTGNFNAFDLEVNETKFEGGVGELNIYNSNLGKLNFKAGVGNSNIESKLSDDSEVKCGVGNVTLNLIDGKEEYYFDIETGLGNIFLDEEKVKNGTFGNKEAKNIDIEGGIGNIKIKF